MATRRVRKYESYFIIWHTPERVVQKVKETFSPFDDANYESGNYYLTKESALVKLKSDRAAYRAEVGRIRSRRNYYKRKSKHQ